MKKIMLSSIVALAVLAAFHGAPRANDAMLLLRFQASDADSEVAESFFSGMRDAGGPKFNLQFKTVPAPETSIPFTSPDTSGMKEVIAEAGKRGASYALTGRISASDAGIAITAYLVPVSRWRSIYQTSLLVKDKETLARAAEIIAGRLFIQRQGKSPEAVRDMKAVPDNDAGKIALAWEGNANSQYAVYRSPFQEGPFEFISESRGTAFDDATAEPGMEYWYGAGSIIDGAYSDPSSPVKAHLAMKPAAGLNIAEMQKAKTVRDDQIRKQRGDKIVKAHLKFIEKYYMHPIKLSLVFMMSKSYINDGKLTALAGFTGYERNTETGDILLKRDDNAYAVLFQRSRFPVLMDEAEKANIEDREGLIDRLVKNSIAYCIHTGEKEIKDQANRTRFIPLFEAIGVSTEYFKNYQNWQGSTIMFGTGNGELKKKMQEVQQKQTQGE